MCGEIKSINPIMPTKEITVPVRADAKNKR